MCCFTFCYKKRVELNPDRELPKYDYDDRKESDTDLCFTSVVFIGGKEYGKGKGRNKKEAKKQAAKEAIQSLKDRNLWR